MVGITKKKLINTYLKKLIMHISDVINDLRISKFMICNGTC